MSAGLLGLLRSRMPPAAFARAQRVLLTSFSPKRFRALGKRHMTKTTLSSSKDMQLDGPSRQAIEWFYREDYAPNPNPNPNPNPISNPISNPNPNPNPNKNPNPKPKPKSKPKPNANPL